jgi:hypothetical protein
MHKHDVPVYVFLAIIISAGFFVAEHAIMAVSNIDRLTSLAAVTVSSPVSHGASVPTIETTALQKYAETKLSGATSKTISGHIEAYYAENKKFDNADTPLHFALLSGHNVYQLHNLSGEFDPALDGAVASLTGFITQKSDKDLYVNLSDSAQLRMRAVHTFPALVKKSEERSTTTCANSFCTLVVLVDTTNNSSHLPTPTDIHDYIFNGRIKNALLEESYNQTLIAGDVTDWIGVNSDPISPFFAPSEVDQYLTNHNINLSNYQQLVFLINGGSQSVGGEGTVGATTYWQNGTVFTIPVSLIGFSSYANNASLTTSNGNLSYFDYLYVHETGHNLNALHDNLLNCKSGPLSLPSECIPVEYGNKYSIMGDGSYGGHFSSLQKLRIGWLTIDDITFAWSGGHSLDPIENSGGTYLGIDGMHDSIPEFLVERRTSSGLDTRSAFPSLNLNGAFLYRLNNPVAASVSTDPFSWDMILVDTTPSLRSDDWYQSMSDVVFKIPQAYNDIQDHVRFSQSSNGNNNLITLSVPIQTDQSCLKSPIKVFEPKANPGDTFTSQMSKQKWPVLAVPNPLPHALVQTLHADVTSPDSEVFLAKNISIFNDDRISCGPGLYTIELLHNGVSIPLLSESSITYEPWSGPHFQTVMAYLPVNGLTYGMQTVTLKITKQNDGTVFTRDLKFDLEQ